MSGGDTPSEPGAPQEAEPAAEERPAGPQGKVKGSRRHRAAQRYAKVSRALDAEREATQRLGTEVEQLREELSSAQEEGQEQRRLHAAERDELQRHIGELDERTRELQATSERERTELSRRIAELEGQLDEAGAEHAREHRHRRELEDQLAAQVRDAEEVQRALEGQTSVASTQGQQLRELGDELNQARAEASAERAQRQQSEQQLEAMLRREAEAEEARAVDESWGFERWQPTDGNEAPAGDQRSPQASDAEASGDRGVFWRRRSRLPCAVCSRPRPAEKDLIASGWVLNGKSGLCAECQKQGWEFPAGAAVPFRRIGPAA